MKSRACARRWRLRAPLDGATLLTKARIANEHFNKPNQHWIEVANGSHGIISTSPTRAKTSCGTSMFMTFVKNPAKGPDRSCLDSLMPISFEGTPELSKGLFDATSPWE